MACVGVICCAIEGGLHRFTTLFMVCCEASMFRCTLLLGVGDSRGGARGVERKLWGV